MSEITITYLEMKDPDQLIRKEISRDICVAEAKVKDFHFNRYLYQHVGEAWQWTDKLQISDEEWITYAESEELRTWVAYIDGSIAGYFELQKQSAGDVELCYFGLTPKFLGLGIGGYLLTEAIEQAWYIEGTKRVWLHTCSLDHPSALANYLARGFKIYKTEKA